MQPLKVEAKWLPSEPSLSRSRASSPDIATLLEVFDEPLRDENRSASTLANPTVQRPGDVKAAQSPTPKPAPPPPPAKTSGLPVKGLISALVGIALVPMAILFVLLWQEMMLPRGDHEVAAVEKSAARLPDSTGSVQSKQVSSPLEVALSSPDRIEANASEIIEFPIAIDATEALPARSIIAITALPQGASFSAGRPYGVTGWSLRPDEISDLQLRLSAQSGASDIRLELVAGDGTVLAQSETQVSIASPAEIATVAAVDVAPPDAIVANPFEQVAAAEVTGSVETVPQAAITKVEPTESVAESPPTPARKPRATSGVKVNTVKVVTIMPPQPTRPHDGAYALGSPADAPAEWMETKTAVDMHAKAEQSSETVKIIGQGGIKLRVMARDKNWVQVNDPASSTTGWIYNRFLKPTDPPAQ